jgi:hypothetical protein
VKGIHTVNETTNNQHLWDSGHSYYCSDSSWSERDAGEEYNSWTSFVESYGDADKDYNLLFRWDWSTDKSDDELVGGPHRLKLYFVQQRKGRFWPVIVTVTKEDEPAIKAYLATMWTHLKSLWQPIA